jgi:hypothetical protein
VGCPRLEVEGFYEYPAVSVAVGQWPDERHHCLAFPVLVIICSAWQHFA